MSLILNGIGVSKGITIGTAYVLQREDFSIREFFVPKSKIKSEISRFHAAVSKAVIQLKSLKEKIPENTSVEISAFIDTHLLMINDFALSKQPAEIIKTRQCNAEWALKMQRDSLVAVFESMNDAYLKTRRDDVDHVVDRIQRILMEVPDNKPAHSRWLEGGVVIADDISPADTLVMQQNGVSAIVTEYGGSNSHTAILARSMGIPAVVGIHHIQKYVAQHETVIIDGQQGVVIVGAELVELNYFRKQRRKDKRRKRSLDKLRDKPTVTKDGVEVFLNANIELTSDINILEKFPMIGVGLLRTEILFLNKQRLPDEQEQYKLYADIVRAMNGLPVTIRTLDLGADKLLQLESKNELTVQNPALGLRAIRWCLSDPQLFSPQVRAILRAAQHGNVRMMIPMLSGMDELKKVLDMIEREKSYLRRLGIDFNENLSIGAMIEVPGAAVTADFFAEKLDFLSIGTNDLIQYTLAVDRLDDEVNYLYDPLNPAILKLIHMIVLAGKKKNVPVSMCGEMAGDPNYTRLLMGLGLRDFSMFPASILEVKKIVNNTHLEKLENKVSEVLKLSSSAKILTFVEHLNRTN